MGLACAIWLDYFSYIGKHPEQTISRWYFRVIFLVLALTFGSYIAYTRVVLGVHSINQVLFGLMLGVWYAGTAHFIVNKPLKKLIRSCIEGKETRLLRLFLISTAIYVTLITVQVINFEHMKDYKNPAEWIKNVSEKCNFYDMSKVFQAKSLTDFGDITFVFGSFYAILVKAKFFPNLFTGILVNDTLWKNLLRPVISGLLAGAVYLFLLMIL